MTYNLYKLGTSDPVAHIEIVSPPEGTTYYDIQWDSNTGMVSALIATPNNSAPNKRTAIPYSGIGRVVLEPGYYFYKIDGDSELKEGEGTISGLQYHYWYY